MQASFETQDAKDSNGANLVVFIIGVWDFNTPQSLLSDFADSMPKEKQVVLDFSRANKVDFNAISFLFLNASVISWQNASPGILSHIQAFQKFHDQGRSSIDKKHNNFFWFFGKKVYAFYSDARDFIEFLGCVLYHLYLNLRYPSRFRFKSFCHHINESGFKALPIATLTTFIVSGAIALQSAIELQSLGAPLLSVEITAKLSLREIGPFILTLIIIGRSASSYTAQIGVMNITEETNAMRVMNFNLIDFLAIPRFLALVIVMPLMVFLADAASIFGGMLAVKFQLDVNFMQYLQRFTETVGWSHFFVGLVKAPFFGAIIALVGCFRGLQAQGETELIGRATTTSVVNTLFWVIFVNAIFSIIFTRLDV
ncbi:MlaE family ABC transporter permease [Helicobacter mustelae]|uniref:MlaE family ABC transporter permease n=2 Tax=Helicobacter mustelae TaxID=217 RepID=UPI000DA2F290|nr:ABC transporter permease [Helicobacter mustelae]SQH72108.1 putative ABC transport system, permease protein [Helicobacter mustelae]